MHGVDGQNHKGQVSCTPCPAAPRRRYRASACGQCRRRSKKALIRPLSLQHGAHGVGAQKEVHPHRQKDQHENSVLCRDISLPRQKRRRRIAHHQAHRRAFQGQPHAEPEGFQISGGEKFPPVVQGKGAGSVRKSIIGHEQQRQHRKHDHPHHIGPRKEGTLHFPLTASLCIMWILNGTMERPTLAAHGLHGRGMHLPSIAAGAESSFRNARP